MTMAPHPVPKSRLLGEVLADFVAERIGSWGFVLAQSALIAAWIAENAAGTARPDPYPFILLNLLLSLQAAYTGPVLLISQNRSAAKDRALLLGIERRLSHMAHEHDEARVAERQFRERVLAALASRSGGKPTA